MLLLVAAVRHRVPDGKICCWFIESVSSVSFSSFKRDVVLMHPLAVLCRIYGLDFGYILGNYGHARRQGGRQSAAA